MEDLSSNKVPITGQSSGQPTGQNLGIAALITAIITFVLAVIPCVGLIAIIPAIIAIVLASVGISQAVRNESPRGILIAGLIIGIVAFMISFSQFFVVGEFARKADKWPNKLENIFEDVQDNVIKELEDANISIKIENGDEKVEITTNVNKSDREKTLEDLEKGNVTGNDTVVQKK
jgi:phosphate/sulfate permease